LYDAKADQFLADRFVGTCQNVATKKRMEINVKKCGSTLNATDLINPKSTITKLHNEINETLVLPLDR
jgi:methionyl-tRNA synthetase